MYAVVSYVWCYCIFFIVFLSIGSTSPGYVYPGLQTWQTTRLRRSVATPRRAPDSLRISANNINLLPQVLAPPGVALYGRRLEERGGFEPPRPVPRPNGFQDRRIRPLCHLSDKLYFNVTTINCLKTYWPLKNWSYFVSNYEGLACHT